MNSVFEQKGEIAIFWHPQNFYNEIRTDFYKIQTVKQFWQYANNTLADNLFMTLEENTTNETSSNRRLQSTLFDARDELNIYKKVAPEDNDGEITTTIDPGFLNQWLPDEI